MCAPRPRDTLDAMTTTDPSVTPPPAETRTLRRSRTDRVGAGVAGGLGSYFGLDPVLFRVLFATAAFFGGAGILAYLLAWAAIPEEGTGRAPIDGWIRELRRRQVPFWLVAGIAGLLLWIIAFSWWAPGPFIPVLLVVVLLAAAIARSGRRHETEAEPDATVSLAKEPAPDVPAAAQPDDGRPAWMRETRDWIEQSKVARRRRRRRALPVKIATLTALVATLLVLALVDAASGVPIPAYFWTAFGIVVAGLLVGVVLRRTPWSIATLLVPAIAGTIAFAGSSARLHDGVGDRQWRPSASLASTYRLGLGQGTLDLRKLPAPDAATSTQVYLGAGQVRVLAPSSLNLTIYVSIHIGALTVDGDREHTDGGYNFNRTIDPPAGATGAPVSVEVYLTDGHVDIERS